VAELFTIAGPISRWEIGISSFVVRFLGTFDQVWEKLESEICL
jgi:hypothetical protein